MRLYKRREYCNDINCKIQVLMNNTEKDSEEYEKLRDICKTDCIHSTYDFHHWLDDNRFEISKEE